VRVVSDSLGYDGETYFCRLCGKAGYRSLAAAKGHLAQCPGKMLQKHGVSPAVSAFSGSPGGGQPPGQLAAASYSWAGAGQNADLQTSSYQQQRQHLGLADAGLGRQVAELSRQVSRLSNEYHHMVLERNVGFDLGEFFRGKWFWTLAVGLFLAYSFGRQNCSCPSLGEPSKSSGGGRSLGSALSSKALDRVVSKGIDRIFR